MTKIKKYYNLDKIDNMDANYNLIYGERSGGKSWQCKHKKGVLKYIKTGKRFILLRRYKDEITPTKVENYFKDVDIDSITDGKYDCVIALANIIYLAKWNDKNKKERGEVLGYYMALSQEQNFAGGVYLDVEDVIFEEFISRTYYLKDEPSKLLNLYCTIDRKRRIVKLWLVGNTISKVVPYFSEWGMYEQIKKQKQGTIITGLHRSEDESGEEVIIKIACEWCEEIGYSSGTIGKHSNMLNKGAFQTDPQPHLPKSYKDYKSMYRIMFIYKSFKFIGEYLKDLSDGGVSCWFIYPYDGEVSDKILVFSDIIKVSKYWQCDIYQPLINNPRIKKLLSTFRENNIFYSDDSCGTDFKQVINFDIKK